jgi:hypothetical protein
VSPNDYLNEIKACLMTAQIVTAFAVVEEWCLPDRGYLRVRITLSTGDFLESAEYVVERGDTCGPERYRHQWMDSTKTMLRRRWDNVPHHPEVENFPHHVHLPDGRVQAGVRLSICEVLQVIADEQE